MFSMDMQDCRYKVVQVGGFKVLRFDCSQCAEIDTCLEEVLPILERHPDVNEVILSGVIEAIYTGEALETLKDYSQILQRIRCLSQDPGIAEKLSCLFRLPVPQLHDVFKELSLRISRECPLREDLEEISQRPPPKPLLKPAFVSFRVNPLPPAGELLEEYSVAGARIRIFRTAGSQYFYHLLPPEFRLGPELLSLLHQAKMILLNTPLEPSISLEGLRKQIEGILSELARPDVEPKKTELSEMLFRHTAGFGFLEYLLQDPNTQDVYINAPPGSSPVHLSHTKYDECLTNVYASPLEVESLVSKLRAWSGEPFSEVHPLLELDWRGVRVTVAGKPLSPEGISFSFRKPKSTPWTLPQLVMNGLMPPVAAALLSLATNASSCILITGTRGAGKTSLLGALLFELHPKTRLLVLEDTPELPVGPLRRLGYEIQTLRLPSPFSHRISVDRVFRAVLRMGESVLVIGEVRGKEARMIFEAMRIGAIGNSVMGTIHASSSSDVVDRLIHDLGVSWGSFKATDLVVCVGPVRMEGLTRERKMLQLTEVRKVPKLSLRDLVRYETRENRFKVSLRDSHFLRRISRTYGLDEGGFLRLLREKTRVLEYIIEVSRRMGRGDLLEAPFVVKANLTFYNLLGKGDLFERWKTWFHLHL